MCKTPAAECVGVPTRCSSCCAVCGYGLVLGEEGAGRRCGLGKYWPTWECWSSHFTLTPSQTQMWFLTPSLNQHFGLWSISLEGLARCVFVWFLSSVTEISNIFFLTKNLTRVYVWQVFVCLVVVLTSSIVIIAYVVLLPLILNTYSPPWIAWHVCYGHWNLIMIAFHYYKAAKTSPGYLPSVRKITFMQNCKWFPGLNKSLFNTIRSQLVFIDTGKKRQPICIGLQKMHYAKTSKNTPLWYL